MRGQGAIDRGIAALAGAQHGMLSRTQLRVLGLSDDAIDRRVACARLHVVHRGVYAVGRRVLTVEARWMAAVLAAGADAVLSHGSAAAAWELRRAGAGAIHVTVPGHGGRKSRAGVRLHRSATLDPEDITTHRAIPITTPARTIIDLATLLNGRPLEQALDRAEQLGLIDFADLANRLQAHPTRPGSPSLQAMLSRYTAGTTPTRSELEERFLALCDDHGIRRPDGNTRIEGEEVDFVWRDARLIVEVDGYAYHRSPTAFEAVGPGSRARSRSAWRLDRADIAVKAPWARRRHRSPRGPRRRP